MKTMNGKKKWMIWSVVLALFVTTLNAAPIYGEEDDAKGLISWQQKGDVNRDGVVSIADVTALVNYILGKQLAEFVISDADVNSDGCVSIADVTSLVNIILNKPVEEDYSRVEEMAIAVPKCALVNIHSDFNLIKLRKLGMVDAVKGQNCEIPVEVEFRDDAGHSFRKWALMSGQGNTSMVFPKKNIKLEFYNQSPSDEGFDDENTFDIRFGNWVPGDTWHLKANYIDYFRGISIVAYQLANEVWESRGPLADRPWKKALNVLPENSELDMGARCIPDAFPCMVFQNGEFYGLFAFAQNKNRANYQQKKNIAEHVHLDGKIGAPSLFGGIVNWTQFEVRNPKKLVYAVPHEGTYKYDADVAQAEIAGIDVDSDGNPVSWIEGVSYPLNATVEHNGHYFLNTVEGNMEEPLYDEKKNADDDPAFTEKKLAKVGWWINITNTVKVKQYIMRLAQSSNYISKVASDAERKGIIETYFDVDNLIDYVLTCNVLRNNDAYDKNWQWVTYDGVKWYVCFYDMDLVYGSWYRGGYIVGDGTTEGFYYGGSASIPTSYPYYYYKKELKQRFQDLVDKGIFTHDNIMKKVEDWMKRMGANAYASEWEKWPESPCNRDDNAVVEFWKRLDTYSTNITSNILLYESDKAYHIGDKCAVYANGLYYYFICVKDNIGVYPADLYTYCPLIGGYRDSVERLSTYAKNRLERMTQLIQAM